jgi:hypothetical protein
MQHKMKKQEMIEFNIFYWEFNVCYIYILYYRYSMIFMLFNTIFYNDIEYCYSFRYSIWYSIMNSIMIFNIIFYNDIQYDIQYDYIL